MSKAVVAIASVLLAYLPASALGASPRPPLNLSSLRPPFSAGWDYKARAQIVSRVVAGNTAFLGTLESIEAIDLRTGKRLWQRILHEPEFMADLAYDGRTLWANVGMGRFLACDPRTGRTLWSLRRTGYSGPTTSAGGAVYTEIDDGTLAAVDARRHRVRWTADLEPKAVPATSHRDLGLSCPPVPVGADLYVASCDGHVLRLNALSGAIKWKVRVGKPDGDAPAGIAVRRNRVFCTLKAGRLLALDTATGKRVWSVAAEDHCYTPPVIVARRVLFTSEDGALYAVNATDGRLLWRQKLTTGQSPYLSAPLVRPQQVLVAGDGQVWSIGVDSKRIWNWSPRYAGVSKIIAATGRWIVVSDSSQLTRFDCGAVSLPASEVQRRALAARLALRGRSMSVRELERFLALGGDAFNALVPVVRKAISASNLKGPGFSNMLEFNRAVQLLCEVATPGDTRAMVSLLRLTTQPGGGVPFARWLAAHGDHRQAIPALLDVVRAKDANWGASGFVAPTALEGIAQSKDPRAVHFLIAALGDTSAAIQIRHAAFVNLARVAGKAGLEVVLAMREPNVVVLWSEGRGPGTASGRPRLGDTEKVLAAAFEGHLRFASDTDSRYRIVFPPGVNVLALRSSATLRAGKMEMEDAPPGAEPEASIIFGMPSSGFQGGAVRGHSEKECILWNRSHTEAMVEVNKYYGAQAAIGFEMRVRKFGSDWVTVGERMAWIS